jgi:hypothetical protein
MWGFEKNIPQSEMKEIVAIASKRSRDEGLQDVLIERNGYTIPSEKIKNAKRRKTFRESLGLPGTAHDDSRKLLRSSRS